MLLPEDLRKKLTQSYVDSLPADARRKLIELLTERNNLEVHCQARKSLIEFTEHTFPKYRPAAFHRIIAGQLERVERGDVDRLMLLLPPRTANPNWHPSAIQHGCWAETQAGNSFRYRPRRN